MLVSIVIPCYNSEHTIGKVVELAIEMCIRDSTRPDKRYEVGSLSSNPEKIKITGPKSLINKIDKVNASIDVDGATEDVTQETEVKIIDKNGEDFSDTDASYLTISKVYVTARLWKVKTDVKISAEYTGTCLLYTSRCV